jgi:hypothetical protein
MKTVEEILRESGLTDEQIKAIDAKAVTAITGIVTTASQTLEQAELAKRAQQHQYDTEIAPALDKWANDSANIAAERDYYKTLALKAKEGGFVPAVEPFTPPATPGSPVKDPATGKFVPSGTQVHTAPTGDYLTKKDAFDTITAMQWTMAEYMRLHNGAVPPDDMAALANEAVAARMPYRQYVEKKYDFGAKREKIKLDAQKAHDDAIRKEESERVTKEITERLGSNPMVRQAETSQFSEVRKAVADNKRPDPLKMSREERRNATRQQIQKDFAEHAAETVQ